MACGHCSCGGGGGGEHNHGQRSGGGRLGTWAAAGALLLVLGIVGAAIALEPPAAPAKPADPKTTPPEKAPSGDQSKTPAATPASPYVLGYSMKRIDGTEESLETYKGKVVLIVNVASKCGYTPQYEGLEKLYKDKKDAGLVVLGFPANNFRSQEPGSNKDIAEFCSSKFGVTFPMFEKISVTGSDQHPLYKQLAAQAAPIGGDPKWNFTKFLVDRHGNVVARFDSKVKPDDAEVTKKIDELLAQK
jgi:glutathione peroxidase